MKGGAVMTANPNGSMRSMKLSDLVEQYIASRPALRRDSIQSYRFSLRVFENHLGRPALIADLNEAALAKFVNWRLANFSPFAARRDNISLMTFWHFAARQKLTTPPIRGIVPPIKIPPRKNQAGWTAGEFGRLLTACDQLKGRMRTANDPIGCHRDKSTGALCRDWWRSLLLFLFDTNCPIGTATRIAPDDIDLKCGLVTFRADITKTRIARTLKLKPQTIAAIRKHFDPASQLAWDYGRRHLYLRLSELLRSAGLPCDRTSKFQRITTAVPHESEAQP
jgi:integrase